MDFLRELLFESLPMLLVLVAIVLSAALAVHRRRASRASRRGLLIAVAVCAGLIVMQTLVVTDHEAIRATIRNLARAVDAGDVPAIAADVDEAFTFRGSQKPAFIDQVDRTLQRWRIDEVSLGGFRIDITGDEAEISFRAHCDLRGERQEQAGLPSFWKVRMVRRGRDWKLLGIESGKVSLLPGQGGLDVLSEIR